MTYPPEPAASERRCTVTGLRHDDGAPLSLVCEASGGGEYVVIYPHGLAGQGVVLGQHQQRVLARWLLDREPTPRRRR